MMTGVPAATTVMAAPQATYPAAPTTVMAAPQPTYAAAPTMVAPQMMHSQTQEQGAPVHMMGPAVEHDGAAVMTMVAHEQIVQGSVQQQHVMKPTHSVQEHFVEVPEIQVVEHMVEVPHVVQRTVEHIVHRSVEQIVHVPVPHI